MKLGRYEFVIGSMDSFVHGPFVGLSIDDIKSVQGWIFNINWILWIPLVLVVIWMVSWIV